MFVTKARYERMYARALAAELQLAALTDKWAKLVTTINKKGGQEFLDTAVIPKASPLSKEDIAKLLTLCHPDKHDGKPIATEMTQKLLSLRKP